MSHKRHTKQSDSGRLEQKSGQNLLKKDTFLKNGERRIMVSENYDSAPNSVLCSFEESKKHTSYKYLVSNNIATTIIEQKYR